MADFATARLDRIRYLANTDFVVAGTYYPFLQVIPPALPAAAPFDRPMRVIKLINMTDVDMRISFDGTTFNDFVPANGGFSLYDLYTNSLTLQNLTQLWAATDALALPSKNSIYLIGIYGKG